MYRSALEALREWKAGPGAKPLVVRGARQTGKSTLIRMFAKEAFDRLLEINLEQTPDTAALFSSNDPMRVRNLLEARFGVSLEPGRTLLFLDEIQAAPQVFAALRYLHEGLPEQHVIAAGSLLEFVLEQHEFSMPVGRIEYLHLGPMQFEEFLLALKRDALCKLLRNFHPGDELPPPIHQECMNLVQQFLLVGGMPEAVAAYARNGLYRTVDRVKEALLATYRDDFAKYGARVNSTRLAMVFNRVPQLVGGKLKYGRIDADERSRDLKQALHQLALARVLHLVPHAAANGVPLGAEVDPKAFKVLFLDVGLLCSACGLDARDLAAVGDVLLVNRGAVCEQFVGQHLLYSRDSWQAPELYCWMREKPTSPAEVDYLIAAGATIVPVEVKAGKTGTLKSLHVFLREKKRSLALRFNSAPPSLLDTHTSLADGHQVQFRLLSLPLYLIGQARRLLREVSGN